MSRILTLLLMVCLIQTSSFSQEIAKGGEKTYFCKVGEVDYSGASVILTLGRSDGIKVGDEFKIITREGEVEGWILKTKKWTSEGIVSQIEEISLVRPGDKALIEKELKKQAPTPKSSEKGNLLLQELLRFNSDMQVLLPPPFQFDGELKVSGGMEEFKGFLDDTDKSAKTSLLLKARGKTGLGSKWYLRNEFERSDTFLEDDFYADWETKLRKNLTFETDLNLRVRDYLKGGLDDQFSADPSFSLEYKISPKISLEGGFNGFYYSEYKGKKDNGYSLLEPYIEFNIKTGKSSNLTFGYEYSDKSNKTDEDKDFNYTQNEYTLEWSSFLSKLYVFSEWNWTERDYQKENGDEDFEEIQNFSLFNWYIGEKWSLGFSGNLQARFYDQVGASDTDFVDWKASPSISFNFWDWLGITIDGKFRNWQNQDRKSGDGRNKSLENFKEFGWEAFLTYTPHPDFYSFISYNYVERKYPKGETGFFPFYSSDFDIIANRTENSASFSFNWDILQTWEFQGSIFYTEQEYKNYSTTDNSLFTADLSLKYKF